jgi:hypothetical protein
VLRPWMAGSRGRNRRHWRCGGDNGDFGDVCGCQRFLVCARARELFRFRSPRSPQCPRFPEVGELNQCHAPPPRWPMSGVCPRWP